MIASIATLLCLIGVSKFEFTLLKGFTRNFVPFKISPGRILAIGSENMYIAGVKRSEVLLGSYAYKNKLLKVNLRNGDTTNIYVKAPKGLKIYRDVLFQIDSNRVFLVDGIKGQICIGSSPKFNLTKFFNIPQFSTLLPLSNSSFIARSINEKKENVLLKHNLSSNKTIVNADVLTKQIDGLFSTDGILFRVPASAKVLYLYYYTNEIMCLDTNLHLLYKSKTIDTISKAQLEILPINHENKITLASPPLFVNKFISCNKDYLFVNSGNKADNESMEDFTKMSVIDVYTITEGRYKFSFYLPKFREKKLNGFEVHGNTLVALFGPYLSTFKLNF